MLKCFESSSTSSFQTSEINGSAVEPAHCFLVKC